MEGTDDICPQAVPPGPLAVQLPMGGGKAGRKRIHDACYHTADCKWCGKRKEQGKCERLAADCKACEADQEAAAKAQAAAAGGGSTLPPTSPMALRSQKKGRVEEEEEEEEEMEWQEEEDEEEEEVVREQRFTADDMRDVQGELNRELLFLTTFDALRPPEDGPLSNYWRNKFMGMKRGISDLWQEYNKHKRCVFPSILSFLIHIFLLISLFFILFSPNSSPPPSHSPSLNTDERGGT